jgi:MoaA/NifB/PqqE/SkfB family radical SAM enzyme
LRLYLNLAKHILYHNLGWIPYPSICTYLITWRCELNCYMCSIPELQDKGELYTSQVKALFEQFKGLDVVRITGGEPFVRRDLEEIVEHILVHCNPSTVVLNTNGYQSQRIVEFAKGMASAGSCPATFHFRVSLDGVGGRHDEIRGVKGSFERAQQTLEGLVRLRKGKGLSVGVNLTITRKTIDQIEPLQGFCQRMGIDLQYQVARRDRYLYENYQEKEREMELDFFDNFSQDEIDKIVGCVSRDNTSFDFREGLVKKFFNEGLKNRLLYGKREPDTQCVALTSHIKILPDGKVPICIQSNTKVGDLTKETLEELWFGQKIERYRKMVRECPGCWMPCDVVPSAIYTGSLFKALL